MENSSWANPPESSFNVRQGSTVVDNPIETMEVLLSSWQFGVLSCQTLNLNDFKSLNVETRDAKFVQDYNLFRVFIQISQTKKKLII